ncbi:MAG: DUF1801 domain-containing protein [bacterium]|nr:DUF1801 domain-containing protein [bacterium]
MSDLKTKKTNASVKEFLDSVKDEQQRKESFIVLDMMKKITGTRPTMWGTSIVGFGKYHYKYDSGREGDWFQTGFSPRKQALTLYIMAGFSRYDALLKKLGKFKTGKSCLYIKKLDDVDQRVLKELIKKSVDHIAKSTG